MRMCTTDLDSVPLSLLLLALLEHPRAHLLVVMESLFSVAAIRLVLS